MQYFSVLSHTIPILLLAFFLNFLIQRWICYLYHKSHNILSFPEQIAKRSRWRSIFFITTFALCMLQITSIYDSLQCLYTGIALFFLLLITCTDYEQYTIFDAMLLPFAGFGLLSILHLQLPLADHLLAAFCGSLVFLLLAFLSRGGIGGGDIKLIAVLGLWFGTDFLRCIIITGFIFGGLAAFLLLLTHKKSRSDFFAYGPYFTLSAIFFLLFPS